VEKARSCALCLLVGLDGLCGGVLELRRRDARQYVLAVTDCSDNMRILRGPVVLITVLDACVKKLSNSLAQVLSEHLVGLNKCVVGRVVTGPRIDHLLREAADHIL
jgi:hypothetical protein